MNYLISIGYKNEDLIECGLFGYKSETKRFMTSLEIE